MDDPAGAVVRWLRCATQWSVALSEIIQPTSRAHKILLARDVQVMSVQVPTVVDPDKQAPLDELLDHVLSGTGISLAVAVHSLQSTAANNITNPNGIDGWNRLTSGLWDQWSTTFKGKYHCESVLASLIEMKSDDNEFVAIANVPPHPFHAR